MRVSRPALQGDSTRAKGHRGNEKGGLGGDQDRQARLLLLSGQGSSAYGEKRLHIPLRDVYCGMPGWIGDPQARDGCQRDQTGEDDPVVIYWGWVRIFYFISK